MTLGKKCPEEIPRETQLRVALSEGRGMSALVLKGGSKLHTVASSTSTFSYAYYLLKDHL